jgi:dihydrofolate synthase / folylpolyglutamate synthase
MRRAAEVGATIAREGFELGVLSRDVAVGGQLLTLRGLAGEYEDVFVPLHGEHQARNAVTALGAVEAFVGAVEGKQIDIDLVRRAFAGASSPGRLEVVRHSPTVVLDAAHNPHGAQATADAISESFAFAPLIGVLGCMVDKDVYGMLEAFEPVMETVVCTQNSTARAMPAAELGAEAEEVFGEDRVVVVPRLDDALDEAIRLAEEKAAALGSGGVLVTGSVITAGEARLLLTGGRS